MRHYTADFVLTEWGLLPEVLVSMEDDGRVAAVECRAASWPVETKVFEGVLCPGFVNAHCHLELSWMKGMLARGCGMREFIRTMLERRYGVSPECERFAAASAMRLAAQTGTALIADVSNTDAVYALYDEFPELRVLGFRETLGLDPAKAQTVVERALAECRDYVTVHSFYSSSRELWSSWRRQKPPGPVCIHLLESPEERDFFDGGTTLNDFFVSLGLPPIPEGLGRIEQTPGLLNPDEPTLFVHMTVAKSEEIAFLLDCFSKAYFCFCPRSNLYLCGMLPVFERFDFDSGRVCIGTDSLATNDDLSIIEELKTIQSAAPWLSLETLLYCATRNGANFLGMGGGYGTLRAGARPGLVGITNVSPDGRRLTDESRAIRLI
ncbi:MAG: amidohydrolase family protein [Bacteroidia bacterium]|nr:amidohydrolase family protein [Bacteroidia bacterium]MDW8333580.1 amidohydrolase family protein [Bacteroidia bacterium]